MMMGSQPVCQMGPAYTSQGFHVSLTSSISNSKEDTSPTCSSGGALRFLSLWRTVDSIAMAQCALGKTKSGAKTVKPESRPLWARLAKLYRLCGLGYRISLLQ